jgi:TonB-linked SusC/RagA family outer membrane protein
MQKNALLKCSRLKKVTKFLVIMKLTTLLLVMTCMTAYCHGYSQGKINLKLRNAKIKSVLNAIEHKTNYRFIYNDNLLPHGRININAEDETINQLMQKTLEHSGLSYKLMADNLIAIGPNATFISNITVSGLITDSATGQPLIGVTIKVKGSNIGTVTDNKGQYSLDVPDNAVLVVSYIGYESQQISVSNRSQINIVLKQESSALSQIVVVGYGTEKKADLTGSVATVSSKQLEDRPVTSITNALEGTVAGVTVVQNNGQPGRDAGSINIRGIGTLNNSSPMVIVDGMISTMNDVNPNDIATISVLKDAASAAIYGSRAANGVIVITTKKGKEGTLQVQYDTYLGKQTPTALPDYLPSWQAATLYNEALANEGKPAAYTDADIQAFKDGSDPYGHPNTNWLGLFYKGSGIQDNQYISLSGGSAKTQYMFSFGYLNQEGNVKKTDAKHYTFRMNLNSQVSKRLSGFADISYSYEPYEEPASSYPGAPGFSQVIRQINRISPTIPYKYANGDYGYIADGSPMAWLESSSFNKMNPWRLRGVTGLDWEIVKGLHITPSFSYQLQTDYNKQFIADIQYYDPVTGLPSFNQGPSNVTDHYDNYSVATFQTLLEYTKNIGNHHFKLLGGYSQEYDGYNQLEGYRQDFLNNSLSDLDAASTSGQTSEGYSTEVTWQSFFGRLNYDYKGKYLLEANLRDDGSSRFDTANRWGLFPSVSAGWRISEENFFSPLKRVISNLKIRGSWGQLGNAQIGGNELASDYGYITTVSSGQNYIFGGANPSIAAGVAPVYGANTNVKWETTTESDIGIDAGFLQDRISLTADYFIKNTTNILIAVPVGAPYGLVAPTQNAGAVQNKGLELALSYQDTKGAFSYGVTGNVSFIHNEVTSLDNTAPIISGGTITKVGLPIGAFYGYIAQGLFQTQAQVNAHATQSGGVIGPGDIIYKDISGPEGKPDSVINGDDRTYLGTSFPKIAFGINIVLSWKGFDFTAFLEGKAGVKNYVQGIMLGQVSNGAGKPTSAMLNAWTPSNTSANFPRLWVDYTQNDPSENPSSYWIRSAAYLRFKNLQIGYTFPQALTKGIGIPKVRIYYSGQNIFTFTQFYKWVDPEAPTGESGYDYPQVKVNTIGLNVTF